MEDRRKFERVTIPESARIFVLDKRGNRLGPLRILGRGGMLFESVREIPNGTHMGFHLSDETEDIRREISAVVRYQSPEGIGVEFEKLDADTAVEIGVWIGRYYAER